MSLRWWEVALTFRGANGCLRVHAEGKEKLTSYIITSSYFLLCLGITIPMVRVDSFFIFHDNISILSMLYTLWRTNEFFLFIVALVFSIAFPAAKLLVADYAWRGCSANNPRLNQTLRWIEWLSKWSMLDVLVVALVIFSLKASMLGNATSQPGLYCFAASVLGSALGISLMKSTANRIAYSSAAR